ncbi:carboxylesterase family protein [Candidatus Frankia alpina]|uniref:carboxylesterase family protein n=1 Tax=Candidatus Frankia alpina TaxID=2699483 RepID=UPI002350332E|nr:carboxylesterase family protein [Candidatus Frankia alpina]
MRQATGGTGDCLYLNVYTPPDATAKRNLPVMVYIPGGAFGRTSEPRSRSSPRHAPRTAPATDPKSRPVIPPCPASDDAVSARCRRTLTSTGDLVRDDIGSRSAPLRPRGPRGPQRQPHTTPTMRSPTHSPPSFCGVA